jgi:TonB-dependent receptor
MQLRDLRSGASTLMMAVAFLTVGAPAYAQATSDDQASPASAEADTESDAGSKKADEGSKAVSDQSIIVTARRAALQTSQAIKRDSDTIVDSVTADEAGKLPDNSVTEVLQRVSGVTISRFPSTNGGSSAFQIEGTGVAVRGLPYNTSTVNGEQVFSANGSSAIGWQEVTPELMGGVDVYKASRADFIEGGVSLINLRTRMPSDYKKPQLDVSMGVSYGDQAKRFSPNVSALYTKTFDTSLGSIGFLWDLAYSKYFQQSSNMQTGAMFAQYAPEAPFNDTVGANIGLIPNGYNWGISSNKRQRYGAFQAVEWKPSSNFTVVNTLFYSQYKSNGQGQGAGFGFTPTQSNAIMPVPGQPVSFDEDGAFEKGTIMVGSTGNSVQFANTTAGLDWLPAQYQNLNCGSIYGSPASQLLWDWSPNAPVLVQCTPPLGLSLNGSGSYGESKSSTLNISQKFLWTPTDRLGIRAGAQYIHSRAKSSNMFVNIAQSSNAVDQATIDLTGQVPQVSGLNTAGVLDTRTAYFGSGAFNGMDNTGKMFAGNMDLDYRVSDEGFLRNVSVGVRMARRTENDNFIGTYFFPLGQSWLPRVASMPQRDPNNLAPGNIQYLDFAGVGQSDYIATSFPGYFSGRSPIPSQLFVPNPNLMKSLDWYYLLSRYNGQIPNGTKEQYWDQYIDNNGTGLTKTRILNKAAYVQVKFGHDRMGIIPAFTGNFGVRVFHDSLRSTGLISVGSNTTLYALSLSDSSQYFAATQAGDGTVPFPTLYQLNSPNVDQVRNYSYTRVLPSFNIKFDVSSKFIVRGAASLAAAPPNLNDIRAGGSVAGASIANPNPQAPAILTGLRSQSAGAQLKPVMIRSQDITFEYYPTSQSYFYLDLFAKQIKDQHLFSSFIDRNLPVPVLAFANGEVPEDGTSPAPGVGVPQTLV